MSKINHQQELLRALELLFKKQINTDVEFSVENVIIKAHRNILAAQSPVFEQMLTGCNFRESLQPNKPIPLPQKRAKPFQMFINYLYTGIVDLRKECVESFQAAIEILFYAHEYQVDRLVTALVDFLTSDVNLENAFVLLESGLLLDNYQLKDTSAKFLCSKGVEVLQSPKFLCLTNKAVAYLFSLDEFSAPEIEILKAVLLWHRENKQADLKAILDQIRFDQVLLDGLTFIEVEPLYELLKQQNIDLKKVGPNARGTNGDDISKMRVFVPIENVATVEQGASVISGHPDLVQTPENILMPACMQNKNTAVFVATILPNYNMGSTNRFDEAWGQRNPLGEPLRPKGDLGFITIKLARPYRVESMQFVVNDNQSRYTQYSSGYKVKMSMDNQSWEKLAECWQQKPLTPSKKTVKTVGGPQLLIFRPRQTRYVKIIGNTINGSQLLLNGFECPTVLTAEDKKRYWEKCPNGFGTLLRQPNNNNTDQFTVVLPDNVTFVMKN